MQRSHRRRGWAQGGADRSLCLRRRIPYDGAMASHPRITCDPAVMLGKPVIRGTRITVELILRKLSEGATLEYFRDAYPHLAAEDIHAATAYAADMIADELTLSGPNASNKQ